MSVNMSDWRCPCQFRGWLSSVRRFEFVVLRVTG